MHPSLWARQLVMWRSLADLIMACNLILAEINLGHHHDVTHEVSYCPAVRPLQPSPATSDHTNPTAQHRAPPGLCSQLYEVLMMALLTAGGGQECLPYSMVHQFSIMASGCW